MKKSQSKLPPEKSTKIRNEWMWYIISYFSLQLETLQLEFITCKKKGN